MSPAARLAVRVLVALALLVALGVALSSMDPAQVWSSLAGVRIGWAAAAAVCYVTILPLWAWQWRLLAPPDPARTGRRMLEVVAMTSSVLNTTPMLVGEAAGVVLLVTRAKLSRAAAVSVLAMDQLLVGIAKSLVLVTASLAVPLPPWMMRAILVFAGGVGALLLALLIAAWTHVDLARLGRRALPARLADALAAVTAALSPMRSSRRSGGALALALLKKCVEIAAIVCIQRAFGLTLPVAAAVLVLGMLNLATLLPLVPGNAGIYEAAVVLAYATVGLVPEHALGMAIVQHACFFAALTLPGYWWILRRPVRGESIA